MFISNASGEAICRAIPPLL